VASGQSVLVVDGLSETTQVLKAVLEPRGLRVDRVRGHQTVSPRASSKPNVVVLHEDETLPPEDRWQGVPRVVIGSTELPPTEPGNGEHHLPKPFQYGELIQAIESLLARTTAGWPGQDAL
jgi:hypothetical protein